MPYSSVNAITGGKGVRRVEHQTSPRRPRTTYSAVREDSGSRTTRPGAASRRARTERRARARIERIVKRLPKDIKDEDFNLALSQKMPGYSGTYEDFRDLISLDKATTKGLASRGRRDFTSEFLKSMPKKLLSPAEEAQIRRGGGRDYSANKAASKVFIHELIHANQKPIILEEAPDEPVIPRWFPRVRDQEKWEVEGGAELLSRKLARRLFGYKTRYGPYQNYVNRVRRESGGNSRYAREQLK